MRVGERAQLDERCRRRSAALAHPPAARGESGESRLASAGDPAGGGAGIDGEQLHRGGGDGGGVVVERDERGVLGARGPRPRQTTPSATGRGCRVRCARGSRVIVRATGNSWPRCAGSRGRARVAAARSGGLGVRATASASSAPSACVAAGAHRRGGECRFAEARPCAAGRRMNCAGRRSARRPSRDRAASSPPECA